MNRRLEKIITRGLELLLGVLLGIALTIVYENNFVRVNGDGNVVNIYTICNADTSLLWKEKYFSSHDEKGRKIEFVIAFLTAEKRWKIGSSEYFENGEKFDSSFPKYLRSLSNIEYCKDIIAVGLASEEGDIDYEYNRADKRGDKIIEILRPIVKDKNLYKLNLGKHNNTNQNETSSQRRIIIIGITKRQNEMTITDIKFALNEKLRKIMKQEIGLELNNYTSFELTNPGKSVFK